MATICRSKTSRPWTIGVALALILILTSASPGKSVAVESIAFAYPQMSATILPFLMADYLGLFEKEGLKVKMFQIQGTNLSMQTLISGDIDVTYDGFIGTLGAAAAGGKIKYLAELLAEMPYDLVTATEITSYGDLKGKRVGGAGPGSFADVAMLAALQKRGKLNPRKDLEYVNIIGSNWRVSALLSRQIVATVLNPPSIQLAHQKGFRTLDYISNVFGEWSGQGIITTQLKLFEKREGLRRFVQVSLKGVEAAKQNPNIAIKICQQYLKLDSTTAAEVYNMMINHFRTDGRWSEAGLTNSVNYFIRSKSRDPGALADLADPRFLR